jgi:hypothetical protein
MALPPQQPCQQVSVVNCPGSCQLSVALGPSRSLSLGQRGPAHLLVGLQYTSNTACQVEHATLSTMEVRSTQQHCMPGWLAVRRNTACKVGHYQNRFTACNKQQIGMLGGRPTLCNTALNCITLRRTSQARPCGVASKTAKAHNPTPSHKPPSGHTWSSSSSNSAAI